MEKIALLKKLKVFPALAVYHPATSVALRDVADGKQLSDVIDQQRSIFVRGDGAQVFIKIVWPAFHISLVTLPGKTFNSSLIAIDNNG